MVVMVVLLLINEDDDDDDYNDDEEEEEDDNSAKSQLTNEEIIRHTLVGNQVVTTCTKETTDIKGSSRVSSFTIFHRNQRRTTVVESNKQSTKQTIRTPQKFFAGIQQKDGNFTITLLIRDVTVAEEGLYSCEVKKYNDKSVSQGSMLQLYVHERDEEKNPCKDNWLHFRKHGTCIRVLRDTMTWNESREFCEYHYNADLVNVKSKELDEYISSVATIEETFWIGLKSENGKRDYRWLGRGSSPQYTRWASKNPKDIKGRNCVAKGGEIDTLWRNMKCDAQNGIVCERAPGNAIVRPRNLPLSLQARRFQYSGIIV
ncbi:macrophage mannose receptor 1-like [Elysia marginata]|uniref:Macrophage mannose receptor 1-like n=1 Tax=Elysia marginata TaxID=1093978 RepID=A0AAV4EVM0_9GAST|nr:macrophage mannose receptor 1-like [Elysia marginata]